MEYLASDCAHIAVPLLRAACDRTAQNAKGLPFASEILANATAIIEERQRVTDRHRAAQPNAPANLDSYAARAREYNRDNAQRGSPIRWTDQMTPFRIGDPGEKRTTDANGEVVG